MAWFYLVIAGALEVAWAIGLKQSEGFSKPVPTAFTLATMAASFYLLALAMRSLPAGTAYAVWTGIGAVGTVLLGIVWLGEPVNPGRVLSLSLLVAGLIGLKISSA
ncbi:quaternary ammonium compound-resistance protein SugE [Crenobacter luteus]|uniref:quaternary ammonium compound efflux SMR transporter SugE n=1 Tax=Crenobacter luteus TaxID=1452487 RepID=UPI00104C123F|nr:quaternary ammonium compound efflux SMR transporter SugE [Crenobacter luteus]TCP15737.1 quaternary ammonium compound-resistance protein SugE [Crenobacter luteus]